MSGITEVIFANGLRPTVAWRLFCYCSGHGTISKGVKAPRAIVLGWEGQGGRRMLGTCWGCGPWADLRGSWGSYGQDPH